MNTIESEFGFDEDIMPTTYSTVSKLEPFDAQLYPSAFYYGDNGIDSLNQSSVMMTYDVYHPPQVPSQQGSASPESISSRLSPPVSSTLSPPLLSPHTTITEKIANVNKLPESFLPEFHQYSKETYENGSSNNKKRRRANKHDDDNSNSNSSSSEEDIDGVSAQEIRRQIHIQSEQKRRAQIKDGFEELRQHLPGCINKKMSKAALLHRTVQHLQHLKRNQASLLAELERMMSENEQLRKFQESILQKQALERMYQVNM
ncbi:unnamed protein product [Rhizopus microsporus]